MHRLSGILSKLVFLAVLGIMMFALASNFLIIAQSLFSPLKVISSSSMSPAISKSDAIVITSLEKDEIAEGQIVVFPDPSDPGRSIVHRVVELREEGGTLCAVTKGDANPNVDPFTIPIDRIEAGVAFILPAGGLFLDFLISLPGFLICVVCPLGVLLIYILTRWFLERGDNSGSLLARELLPGSRSRAHTGYGC